MPTTTTTKKPANVDQVIARTQGLVEKARRDLDDLEQRLRIARGTREIVPPSSADTTRNIRRPAALAIPEQRGPFYVGDDGPTDELLEVVRLCLSERERSFAELVELTGARPNRIKGVIVRLQREDERVVNLGTETKALWRILSDEALERVRPLVQPLPKRRLVQPLPKRRR